MYYDYICNNCKYEKEVNHLMKEEPVIKCDKCGNIMKKKITGGVGIIFKGSGWGGKSG
jgi:putative FmdB family regulatory protein